MRLHFLVEGPSEKRLLDELIPRIVPGATFRVYPHQGKGRLPGSSHGVVDPRQRGVLDQLAPKLRAWGRTLDPALDRVVLLVDLDEGDGGDCRRFLARINAFIDGIEPKPRVLTRLAIEEVEAWYLADWTAIKRAFPAAGRIRSYRAYEQDSVCGSWELFQRVIKSQVERKPHWAEQIGPLLDVGNTTSPSFSAFVRGVRRIAGESVD